MKKKDKKDAELMKELERLRNRITELEKPGKELKQVKAALIESEKENNQLKEELQRQRLLSHNQKMEAISMLAGGIVHDLNNILGTIFLNVELAFDDVLENSEANYSLKQILKVCNRAKDLVEQISMISNRDDDIERRPVNIGVVVEETLSMMRAMIPLSIEIQRDIVDTVNPVMADPAQIQQLVVNLCNNAVEAMDENGGILKVELKDINISDTRPGPYVRLTVSDTGTGIEPKVMERVFDPFFTTKKDGKGAGLGLSIVHGIVGTHNGTVTIHSQPGEGTSFRVFFPLDSFSNEQYAFDKKSLEYQD